MTSSQQQEKNKALRRLRQRIKNAYRFPDLLGLDISSRELRHFYPSELQIDIVMDLLLPWFDGLAEDYYQDSGSWRRAYKDTVEGLFEMLAATVRTYFMNLRLHRVPDKILFAARALNQLGQDRSFTYASANALMAEPDEDLLARLTEIAVEEGARQENKGRLAVDLTAEGENVENKRPRVPKRRASAMDVMGRRSPPQREEEEEEEKEEKEGKEGEEKGRSARRSRRAQRRRLFEESESDQDIDAELAQFISQNIAQQEEAERKQRVPEQDIDQVLARALAGSANIDLSGIVSRSSPERKERKQRERKERIAGPGPGPDEDAEDDDLPDLISLRPGFVSAIPSASANANASASAFDDDEIITANQANEKRNKILQRMSGNRAPSVPLTPSAETILQQQAQQEHERKQQEQQQEQQQRKTNKANKTNKPNKPDWGLPSDVSSGEEEEEDVDIATMSGDEGEPAEGEEEEAEGEVGTGKEGKKGKKGKEENKARASSLSVADNDNDGKRRDVDPADLAFGAAEQQQVQPGRGRIDKIHKYTRPQFAPKDLFLLAARDLKKKYTPEDLQRKRHLIAATLDPFFTKTDKKTRLSRILDMPNQWARKTYEILHKEGPESKRKVDDIIKYVNELKEPEKTATSVYFMTCVEENPDAERKGILVELSPAEWTLLLDDIGKHITEYCGRLLEPDMFLPRGVQQEEKADDASTFFLCRDGIRTLSTQTFGGPAREGVTAEYWQASKSQITFISLALSSEKDRLLAFAAAIDRTPQRPRKEGKEGEEGEGKVRHVELSVFCVPPAAGMDLLFPQSDKRLAVTFYEFWESEMKQLGFNLLSLTSVVTSERFWYERGFRYTRCSRPDEFVNQPFCDRKLSRQIPQSVMYKCL